MRVVEAREHLAFGQELVFQNIDMPALKSKSLQRIVNAKLSMLDLIDGSHSALAKKADYLIHADFMSRSK